jgi:hypothetical protein
MSEELKNMEPELRELLDVYFPIQLWYAHPDFRKKILVIDEKLKLLKKSSTDDKNGE